jgi:hypothetical protein
LECWQSCCCSSVIQGNSPNGIIAALTREFAWELQDVVNITMSKPWNTALRKCWTSGGGGIRDNWMSYCFKGQSVARRHCAVGSHGDLTPLHVEKSVDGGEVSHNEDTEFQSHLSTRTPAPAETRTCTFIPLPRDRGDLLE